MRFALLCVCVCLFLSVCANVCVCVRLLVYLRVCAHVNPPARDLKDRRNPRVNVLSEHGRLIARPSLNTGPTFQQICEYPQPYVVPAGTEQAQLGLHAHGHAPNYLLGI